MEKRPPKPVAAGCACDVAPPKDGADAVVDAGAVVLVPPKPPPNKLEPNPPEAVGCEAGCAALLEAPTLENNPPELGAAVEAVPDVPPNKEEAGFEVPAAGCAPPRLENKLGVEPEDDAAVFPPNSGAKAGAPEDAVALEAGLLPKLLPKSDIVTGDGNGVVLRWVGVYFRK